MKKLFALFVVFCLVISCAPIIGPNYNQGISHNADKQHRHKVVIKEDRRMKKAMIRTRKRASRCVTKKHSAKHRIARKII